MTPCPEYREALLTAELDTLRGLGEEPLAVHLGRCKACRRAAEAILDETARLHARLAAVPEAPASADLVREARARGADGNGDRGWWVAGTGLLAAAAVAALLLLPGTPPHPSPPPAVGPAGSGSPRYPTDPPLVEGAPEQDVAILATDDPDITVLWFY